MLSWREVGADRTQHNTVNATNTLIQHLIQNSESPTVNGTNSNNIFGVDPQLGPLQNNGGDTLTMAIKTNSPAFAAGTLSQADLPATDQRGFSRVVNGQLDLGAYEIQAGVVRITATYSDPPGNYRGSSGTGTLTVASASSTVTLTPPLVTTQYSTAGRSVPLSTRVTTGEGLPVNAGAITYTVRDTSGNLVGSPVSAPVSNGQANATYVLPAGTPPGTYTITATYSDPAGNFDLSSGAGTLSVVRSATTIVVTNANIVYSLFNEQETFTAVVLNANGDPVNEGFVTFSDRGQTVTVPVVNNLAIGTLNTPLFSENPFAHSVAVAYSDNLGNFFASNSPFTLEQTLMDFLLQLMALEVFMRNPSGKM